MTTSVSRLPADRLRARLTYIGLRLGTASESVLSMPPAAYARLEAAAAHTGKPLLQVLADHYANEEHHDA